MADLRWLQLPDDEIDAFLGSGGTGVLSFSTSERDPPHSVPVSYGYDADSSHFHFRLALPSEGGKTDLLDRPVSFVTHDEHEGRWQSVVATGTLEDLSERAHESAAIQERWNVDIPQVDIFEHSPDDVDFSQFRLVPDQVSGRKEVRSEE